MSLDRRRRGGLGLWAGLSPAGQRLLLTGTALLLATVAIVGFAVWTMRAVAEDDERANLSRLDIAVSEQTSQSVQAVDLVLLDLRMRVQDDHIETEKAFESLLSAPATSDELEQAARSLPQADAFAVIDAEGRLVSFSRDWPAPGAALTGRDFYRYFVSHDDSSAFISAPSISAPAQTGGDGSWTFYIVRRVDGPGGLLLGMIVGAVDLPYFQTFYSALTGREGLAVALLDRKGDLITGVPASGHTGSRLPPPLPAWRSIVATDHAGVFEAPGLLVPGRRLIAVDPLRDYPLVVDVSASIWQCLADWRREAILVAVGSGCALLCMLLLLRALILQLRRLESQAAALRTSQGELAETSATLRTTLENMDQGIIMIDADNVVAVCNRRALELLNLPAELMATRPRIETVLAHQTRVGEFNDAETVRRAQEAHEAGLPVVYERLRPDGRTLEVRGIPLAGGGTVRTYTDITERRLSEERIRHLAHHDPLTNLANRALLQERLEQGIAEADATGRVLALLYLDLDRFKLINDTRGHDVGDALLVQVAERLLTAAAPPRETVARTGGDEFAIIVPMDEDARSPYAIARTIIGLLGAPFIIAGSVCRISVSIGIAQYPQQATSAAELLGHADIALYKAKREGSGLYRFFDEEMDAHQRQLFLLEQDLRLAMERDQFAIVYQPIIETLSMRIVGCEALLRWHHPHHGLVPPADFIPLAEKLGLIVPIGRWVLESACAEAVAWPADTRLAVNLSPVQVKHETLVADVQAILERTGLAASRLTLEVTEGILLEDSNSVLDAMTALRALGIRFSLDDFGTGHAGLAYLRRFPFDGIKIDKLFVQEMVDQPDARAIVGALLTVSNALNLEVIAEGVENEAQLMALRRRRCPYVQGYFVGMPRGPAEARALILDSRVTAEG